jgi:hypothetical protein
MLGIALDSPASGACFVGRISEFRIRRLLNINRPSIVCELFQDKVVEISHLPNQ